MFKKSLLRLLSQDQCWTSRNVKPHNEHEAGTLRATEPFQGAGGRELQLVKPCTMSIPALE